MVILVEFNLHETQEDVWQFPWAQLVNHQAMNLYFNTQHAHKEIQCLNVEIPQLFTSLLDHHYNYQLAIAAACESNLVLAYELQMQWAYADQISMKIIGHLHETSQLARFLGHLAVEKHVG